MKHVILPPLEEFTPADLREGNATRAIIRNNLLHQVADAIRRAGVAVSHEIPVSVLYLEDGLRVDSRRCKGRATTVTTPPVKRPD